LKETVDDVHSCFWFTDKPDVKILQPTGNESRRDL
jgi:hypothetical protein